MYDDSHRRTVAAGSTTMTKRDSRVEEWDDERRYVSMYVEG